MVINIILFIVIIDIIICNLLEKVLGRALKKLIAAIIISFVGFLESNIS
jgi:hypothetical protein